MSTKRGVLAVGVVLFMLVAGTTNIGLTPNAAAQPAKVATGGRR